MSEYVNKIIVEPGTLIGNTRSLRMGYHFPKNVPIRRCCGTPFNFSPLSNQLTYFLLTRLYNGQAYYPTSHVVVQAAAGVKIRPTTG